MERVPNYYNGLTFMFKLPASPLPVDLPGGGLYAGSDGQYYRTFEYADGVVQIGTTDERGRQSYGMVVDGNTHTLATALRALSNQIK